MIMKQLFRHTTSLLRTALLLGAMILVSIQLKGQTQLPDAFNYLTAEQATSAVGNNNFYYIQFYKGDMKVYLVDMGAGNRVRTEDYMPSSRYLWKLIGSNGEF